MNTTPTEDDLTHLREDNVLEDSYFIITHYKNLPFIVAQSLFTEKYYKLDLDGKYIEPKGKKPTHGTFEIMEILS